MSATPEQSTFELRAIAEAATPGPWGWRGSDDGLIELCGPGTYGPYDARLISNGGDPPCIVETLSASEFDAQFPVGEPALTLTACDSCKAYFKSWQAGEDVDDDYRCPERAERRGTVWVNEPGHGHIVPINRFARRQFEHRPDLGPGCIDHPNARFIEAFHPATVLALLDQLDELRAIVSFLDPNRVAAARALLNAPVVWRDPANQDEVHARRRAAAAGALDGPGELR